MTSTTSDSLLNFIHRTFVVSLRSLHFSDALFGLYSSSCPLVKQDWSLNVLRLMEMRIKYEGEGGG